MDTKIKFLKLLFLLSALTLSQIGSFLATAVNDTAKDLNTMPASNLTILPNPILLSGPRAEQRLLIEAALPTGRNQDLTALAQISSSNPQVVSVDSKAILHAVSDGDSNIIARINNQTVTVPAKVINTHTDFTWSFRNHVLSVMTKVGCNSGACHGAAAGKNGFKLTLRGYDPELDHMVLTRQAAGRRTNLIDPAQSLILLKPTMTIPHGGGKRFEVGSLEYNVLAEWIAAGMPPPKEDDPRIQRLEVLPGKSILSLGQEQQLIVRAYFSDGHIEDVTRWAKYSSADESVARVNDEGTVKMQGYGETAISVWYLSQVTSARVSVPFDFKIDPATFEKAARRNFIDELVLAKLKQLNIAPSEICTDSEFVRRAYLDAAGILPRAEETEKFLSDRASDKRAKLVEALLQRPEFIDYWTYKWSDLLLVSSKKLSAKGVRAYYNWIREAVKANKPWNQFVYELTTARGNSQEFGAVNYFLIHRNPSDLAENYAQAFMGISLTCARCHNHPLEKWTQKDYYGFSNLFSRVASKNTAGSTDLTVFSRPTGEVNHPRLGKPLRPKPLDADPMPASSPEDRRAYVAKWLTSDANPYFARTVVNRVWGNFFARGLVHPVDDLRATNPASNEELFAALTKDFVAHHFDVKHLIGTIMNSASYQFASQASETNVKDDKYFSHYYVRRLPAEVILDAMSQVTGVSEKFPGYPTGTRALQLPDTRVDSFFLTVFGRPERAITSEAERQKDPNVTQALHIINGKTLNMKLAAPGGAVDTIAKLGMADHVSIEHLYLSAYSRYPTDEERKKVLEALRKQAPEGSDGSVDSRRRIFEDLVWALLTSKEFLFNH